MEIFFASLPLTTSIAIFAVALGAGMIKGIVGFAMPMIMISGMSSLISPELALAGLIIPTVATNAVQAFRSGWRTVVQTMRRFWMFLLVGGVFLVLSAQLVAVIPGNAMLLAVGLSVTGFALWQLSGLAPAAGTYRQNKRLDALIGGFAGFIGGMSGIWGPPTVAYLTAIGTEKRMQMVMQGVIYGLGAVALLLAHLGSGVLNAKTVPFSLMLTVPALSGMWLGAQISDRFDQASFRKVTLVVLTLGGLNLIRRGLLG